MKEAVSLEEEVDLLNLNTFAPKQNESNKSPSSNFDLLSGFNENANNSFNVFSNTNTKANNKAQDAEENIFDPFGGTSQNLLGGWSNVPTNSSGNLSSEQQKPNNLFSGIGKTLRWKVFSHIHLDILGGLNVDNWTSNNNSANQSINGGASPQRAPPTTPQHAPSTTPQHQAKSPDYSRSHFDTAFNKGDSKTKPMPGDVFGDLLGSQGYQFAAKKENLPKTINDMRKVELARDMDPDKLRIMEWVDNELFFTYI